MRRYRGDFRGQRILPVWYIGPRFLVYTHTGLAYRRPVIFMAVEERRCFSQIHLFIGGRGPRRLFFIVVLPESLLPFRFSERIIKIYDKSHTR